MQLLKNKAYFNLDYAFGDFDIGIKTSVLNKAATRWILLYNPFRLNSMTRKESMNRDSGIAVEIAKFV